MGLGKENAGGENTKLIKYWDGYKYRYSPTRVSKETEAQMREMPVRRVDFEERQEE